MFKYIIIFSLFLLTQAWAKNLPLRIIENNGKSVTLELGGFRLPTARLEYQITYPKQNSQVFSPYTEVKIGERITFPIVSTGNYVFRLYMSTNKAMSRKDQRQLIWEQDLFAVKKSEIPFSKEQIEKVAESYAPISLFHAKEYYRPASLEYIFNEEETNKELNNLPLTLKVKRLNQKYTFHFSELQDYLAGAGDNSSLLVTKTAKANLSLTPTRLEKLMSLRLGRGHEKIYYSFIPNKNLKEYYLNYHYFYSFDPKGKGIRAPTLSSHVFDRESFTIVLDAQLTPLRIVYRAHLDSQTMAIADDKGDKALSWQGGRLALDWAEAQKFNEHPLIFIAKGSHAIFPLPGVFSVLADLKVKSIELLSEEAGGKQILVPQNAFENTKRKVETYKLQSLDLDKISESNWNRALSFSGNIVDLLGPSDAKFPPFTGREGNLENWVHESYSLTQPETLLTEKASQMLEEVLEKLNTLKASEASDESRRKKVD